jgi:chaperonin GroES
MQPKILSVRKAEYLPAPFFGKNESGFEPIGDRVLVRPDIAASSSGGIELPDDIVDRAQLSASSGVLVALGDDAFKWSFDRTRPFAGVKPEVGSRVCFEKYAGQVILGDDGIEYRLIDDKCVGGVRK